MTCTITGLANAGGAVSKVLHWTRKKTCILIKESACGAAGRTVGI